VESLQEDVGDECDEYECEDGVLFTVEAVVYVDARRHKLFGSYTY